VAQPLDHALGEAPQFFGKREPPVGKQRIGLRANLRGEAVDDGAHDRLFAAEMAVERLLAHAELGGEVVHRERAVAVGEEMRARLLKNACAAAGREGWRFRRGRGRWERWSGWPT